ncbi:MAG: hypothetical protein JSS31_03255 [Proteobacteria bacterium]|nr:hypothetical protein [Pseudomonadota bacterium]
MVLRQPPMGEAATNAKHIGALPMTRGKHYFVLGFTLGEINELVLVLGKCHF